MDAPDLNFGADTDFAIEAWVKVASEDLSDSAMIFNKGDTDGSYWLRVETDGTPRFLLDFGSTAYDVRGATSIADDLWHHVVGVADRDVGLELYVDNVLVDEEGLFDANDVSSTLDMQIGKLGTGSALVGSLDELAIYDYALDEADILAHYQAGAQQVPGDADGDGDVDTADAQELADNWGSGPNATWDMGDFDGDGYIGPGDAAILAANWNYGAEEASSPVPEPATLVGLLSLAFALLLTGRRRR
jgi:hypothetical protein